MVIPRDTRTQEVDSPASPGYYLLPLREWARDWEADV